MGEDYMPLPSTAPKQQKYNNILNQLQFRLQKSIHPVSNRANFIALLKQQFGWWWVGYYFINKNQQTQFLNLGCFQGPPACVKIFKGYGVCGKSWEINQSIVVANVEQFEGHIACSSKSKSEIVIPIHKKGEFIGLLDIDSEKLKEFDEIDLKYLQKMINMLEQFGAFDDWTLLK